jgi:hypothetical protein
MTALWHKLLMTPMGVSTNDEDAAGASGNRSLTVAAPIDSTATPSRAATVRERMPGERLFSRKAPPCTSERSSDVFFPVQFAACRYVGQIVNLRRIVNPPLAILPAHLQ